MIRAPTGGSIEVDGQNIATEREAVQNRIGYLPENDPLYPEMTVIDYLDYAASLRGVPEGQRTARIREAIDKTELTSKAVDTSAPSRAATVNASALHKTTVCVGQVRMRTIVF
jgi:ABC-type multidrug transport system ATPase subunit